MTIPSWTCPISSDLRSQVGLGRDCGRIAYCGINPHMCGVRALKVEKNKIFLYRAFLEFWGVNYFPSNWHSPLHSGFLAPTVSSSPFLLPIRTYQYLILYCLFPSLSPCGFFIFSHFSGVSQQNKINMFNLSLNQSLCRIFVFKTVNSFKISDAVIKYLSDINKT